MDETYTVSDIYKKQNGGMTSTSEEEHDKY